MKSGNVDMYHDKAIHIKKSISEGDLGTIIYVSGISFYK